MSGFHLWSILGFYCIDASWTRAEAAERQRNQTGLTWNSKRTLGKDSNVWLLLLKDAGLTTQVCDQSSFSRVEQDGKHRWQILLISGFLSSVFWFVWGFCFHKFSFPIWFLPVPPEFFPLGKRFMQIHTRVLTTGEYLWCGLGINFARNLYSENLSSHSTRVGQDLITFPCNYLDVYAQLP